MNVLSEETVLKIPERGDLTYLIGQDLTDAKLTCIIAEDDSAQENIELLKNIITALGFSPDNQTLVIVIQQNKAYSIQSFLRNSETTLISFGDHSAQLKTQFNKISYHWIQFKKHKLLFAHKLKELTADIKLKKQLWEVLKEGINIENA